MNHTLRNLILLTLCVAGAGGYWLYARAQTDKEHAELRTEVCGRFVDVGAVARSRYAACLYDDEDFIRSLASAVRSRLPEFAENLNSRMAAIGAAGRHIDKARFSEISYATFEEFHDPFYSEDPEYNPNRDLDFTHLEITGVYGTFPDSPQEKPWLRISPPGPVFANPLSSHFADIDPALAEIFKTTLGWQCRAIQKVDFGCHGTIYLATPEPGPNTLSGTELRIVAFDMAPLTAAQVLKITMDVYGPDFQGKTREDATRNAHQMRLFLEDFEAT